MSPCPATKLKPSGSPAPGTLGPIGLMKITQVASTPYDVYGEVTNKRYSFSEHRSLYVDTRDAVYLLSKEFELGG